MIKTENLTKKYGELYAIKGIEMDLQQGDLFGFIGPNGAGKTTTMRIIATLSEPSWGEAYVCGHSIYNEPKEIRRLVGYMPDFLKCDEMLEVVDLDFKRDAFANTLSRGQTQRLGLARVLLHDPQVLLLDEPLSGLDPRARIEMRNLLRRLGQTGKTIIVSSHILPELADVCNKIGIIDRGVMSFSDDVAAVIKKVRDQIILHIGVGESGADGPGQEAARAIKFLDSNSDVESAVQGDGFIVATLKKEVEDYSEIPTQLIGEGFKLTLFCEEEVNLESAFMALTKGTGANF